jgi:hypothetical protein
VSVLSLLLVLAQATAASSFDDDVAFLRRHTMVVVLGNAPGPQVAVVPAWQGRVATSTVGGPNPPSHGWINRELVASRKLQPHMNAFGGEDRIWLGPEGGQYSIFFAKGAPFDLEHWQTPPLIDTVTWPLAGRGGRHVDFRIESRLVNYSGAEFELRLERRVSLLQREDAGPALGAALTDAVRLVAFESDNTLVNRGAAAWRKPTGLLSIWILGMFRPTPRTTVVIPYRDGAATGTVVNDAYFGKVPDDRLRVKDGVVYFKGDGRHRSKIGLVTERATGLLGSWDAEGGVLTIVTYTLPEGAAEYVNSMWEIQQEPYRGDAVNSYNDGPPAPGAKPLGPFYELETSSPAAALGPGESLRHVHRTFHFQGPRPELDALARRLLGAPLDAIEQALPAN